MIWLSFNEIVNAAYLNQTKLIKQINGLNMAHCTT